MASLGSKTDYSHLALLQVFQIEFSLLIFASIAQLEMGLMDADLICFKNLIQFYETLLNKANKFLFFSRSTRLTDANAITFWSVERG